MRRCRCKRGVGRAIATAATRCVRLWVLARPPWLLCPRVCSCTRRGSTLLERVRRAIALVHRAAPHRSTWLERVQRCIALVRAAPRSGRSRRAGVAAAVRSVSRSPPSSGRAALRVVAGGQRSRQVHSAVPVVVVNLVVPIRVVQG